MISRQKFWKIFILSISYYAKCLTRPNSAITTWSLAFSLAENISHIQVSKNDNFKSTETFIKYFPLNKTFLMFLISVEWMNKFLILFFRRNRLVSEHNKFSQTFPLTPNAKLKLSNLKRTFQVSFLLITTKNN